MNVEGDESRRRLNYYSRSSPKKKRILPQHPIRSPLLPNPNTPPTLHHHHPRPSPRTSRTPSQHSSFRFEVLEVSRSSTSEQILIEDEGEDEILIVDAGEQEELEEEGGHVSAFQTKGEEILISEYGEGQRGGALDIRIEDDQIQQDSVDEGEEDDSSEEERGLMAGEGRLEVGKQGVVSQEDCIKIQNQQPQTMSRQFTFGHELAQAQKAEIEVFPLTIPEQDQQDELSSPSRSESPSIHEPHLQSNLEYAPVRLLPQLNMVLVEQSQQGFDYQSPKFNTLSMPHRRGSDKWITADHYHLLASPPKRTAQILIEQDSKPFSQKSSARTSLSLRPYGKSIGLLSEVLSMVPVELMQVYERMHVKLVGDQIEAEERLQRQEGRMKILRLMLQAKSQGLSCEGLLLSEDNQPIERRIEANYAIIHALLCKIITRGG